MGTPLLNTEFHDSNVPPFRGQATQCAHASTPFKPQLRVPRHQVGRITRKAELDGVVCVKDF